MTLRFGTDGVRGAANTELTPELVLALGRAAADVLGASSVAIGRDTRHSGPLVESALAAGFAAEGVDVDRLGIVPTPAVAHRSRVEGVAGAVISASHNPFGDNGVKFFAPGGRKLTDPQEEALERRLDVLTHDRPAPTTSGPAVGAIRASRGGEDWAAAVRDSVERRALEGLHLVVDCANGAASDWAPDVLRALGATVVVIHDRPDGRNINAGCGSTEPADLIARVTGEGADAGVAFDGDADRVIAVGEDGGVVDGDHIIAICALDRLATGRLAEDTVVVTVMANLGFRLAMEDRGVRVIETPVGDRHVLEALERGGWSVGGEQSGHVIFPELATTGDGLLTAVQLLAAVRHDGRSLGTLAAATLTKLPQVLDNVRVAAPLPDVAERLADDVAAAEGRLGPRGRVLIRPSGTEPVIRVMVEAEEPETARREVDTLVAAVEALDA